MEVREMDKKLNELLWNNDNSTEFYNIKPLLAHYTSYPAAENILRVGEIWFSNPLQMNDYGEIGYTFNWFFTLLYQDKKLREILSTYGKEEEFWKELYALRNSFMSKDASDVYVFCLAEHEKNAYESKNGSLSMWRGYGNDGTGIAIYFDTTTMIEALDSPFVFSKVIYLQLDKLIEQIHELINKIVAFLNNERAECEDKLSFLAKKIMDRVIMASLFTKSEGFSEEREWRVVYFPDIDHKKIYEKFIDYNVLNNGIQKKLKIPIDILLEKSLPNGKQWKDMVDKIVIGPTENSELMKLGMYKMLEKLSLCDLKDKVSVSRTTYRVKK